jgi:hypothetical protein
LFTIFSIVSGVKALGLAADVGRGAGASARSLQIMSVVKRDAGFGGGSEKAAGYVQYKSHRNFSVSNSSAGTVRPRSRKYFRSIVIE